MSIYHNNGYEVLNIRKIESGRNVQMYVAVLRDNDNNLYESIACGCMKGKECKIDWMELWLLHTTAKINIEWRSHE